MSRQFSRVGAFGELRAGKRGEMQEAREEASRSSFWGLSVSFGGGGQKRPAVSFVDSLGPVQ